MAETDKQPDGPQPPDLRTLCNEAQQKLESLIDKGQKLEQQQAGISQALSNTISEIVAQKAYVSGLRVALGEQPLPNSLPR